MSGAHLDFAQYAAETWGSQLEERIRTPLGYGIKNGVRVPAYAAADHYDHVHIADTDPANPGDESGPQKSDAVRAGPTPGGGLGLGGGAGGQRRGFQQWECATDPNLLGYA